MEKNLTAITVSGVVTKCRHAHTLTVWRISPELESRVCVDCWDYFPVTVKRLADGTLFGPSVPMSIDDGKDRYAAIADASRPEEYPFNLRGGAE